MMTTTHLIIGAAGFARPGAWRVTAAALLGAMAPDLSLYLMAGWHLFWLSTPPGVVFNQLYFSQTWQAVFAVDNSFFLWAGLLGFALWSGRAALIAFAGAGLLHLALDFPLHHDDGRMHFWPVSSWIFESPVSYWDRQHYGHIVQPLESSLALALLFMLWRRFTRRGPRVVIALVALFTALLLVSSLAGG